LVRAGIAPEAKGSGKTKILPEAQGSGEMEIALEAKGSDEMVIAPEAEGSGVAFILFAAICPLNLGIPIYGTQHIGKFKKRAKKGRQTFFRATQLIFPNLYVMKL